MDFPSKVNQVNTRRFAKCWRDSMQSQQLGAQDELFLRSTGIPPSEIA